ncbi:MAG: hypothetical protein JF615_00505 [Asticcacaulis sp.]|nr:hypothetical protein [Asticcacaulis sp.]
MLKFLAAVIAMTLPPAAAFAGDTIIGKSYGAAQAELRGRGLVPVKVMYHPIPETCDEGFCETYPEVYYCSGTGTNPCLFVWKTKNGQYKIVQTHGELRLTVERYRDAEPAEMKDFLSGAPH